MGTALSKNSERLAGVESDEGFCGACYDRCLIDQRLFGRS